MTFNRVVVSNHPGTHWTPLVDGHKLLQTKSNNASWHYSRDDANGLVAVWHDEVQGWSVFLFDESEYK